MKYICIWAAAVEICCQTVQDWFFNKILVAAGKMQNFALTERLFNLFKLFKSAAPVWVGICFSQGDQQRSRGAQQFNSLLSKCECLPVVYSIICWN